MQREKSLQLHWIIQNMSRNPHGKGTYDHGQSILAQFKQICQDIGLSLALKKKNTDPNTTITFLGN